MEDTASLRDVLQGQLLRNVIFDEASLARNRPKIINELDHKNLKLPFLGIPEVPELGSIENALGLLAKILKDP